MKNDGWTWSELAGELWARGMDADEITSSEIARVLHHQSPECAAADLAGEWPPLPLARPDPYS